MAAARLACALLLGLVLAACGSAPKRPAGSSVYYQDDGPPEREPADLASVPDAVPRVEAFHSGALRPYAALGRSYVPLTTDAPLRQRGYASWYGRQFHGNPTATGERYDMFAMTAAHPTMPLPSYARVTNLRNGRSVIVRVNDRGPFKSDRVIDLSYAAAVRIGIAGPGTGEVEVERITQREIVAGTWRERTAAAVDVAAGPAPAAMPTLAPLPTVALAAPAPAPAAAASGSRWAVQLGLFAQQANAEAFAARVGVLLGFADPAALPDAQRVPQVRAGGDGYRVLVGELSERAQALELAGVLTRLLEREAFPVALR